MESLNSKVTGSNLAAIEWNQVPSELQNVIEQTGQTLTNADLNQVGKGMASYVANSNFYTDSGTVNSHILTTIGSNQSLVDYVDGMAVEFLAGNTNTGSTTVNVATKGSKDIVDAAGAPLAGGEIVAGERILLKYRDSAGNFIIDIQVPAASVLTGSITAWPVVTIPSDYLECDGAAVLRSTYNDLFLLLGETYGPGDSSTTFNLPDLRGEFIRGWDHGEGNDPDAGDRTDRGDGTLGDEVGTKQLDEFDEHTHTVTTVFSTNTGGSDVNNPGGTGSSTVPIINNSGGNETRPRNVYMIYIIKT